MIRLFTFDFSTDKKYLVWNYFFRYSSLQGNFADTEVTDSGVRWDRGKLLFMKEFNRLSKMLPSETETVQEKFWNNCQPDCPLSFLIIAHFKNSVPVPHETISLITIN